MALAVPTASMPAAINAALNGLIFMATPSVVGAGLRMPQKIGSAG